MLLLIIFSIIYVVMGAVSYGIADRMMGDDADHFNCMLAAILWAPSIVLLLIMFIGKLPKKFGYFATDKVFQWQEERETKRHAKRMRIAEEKKQRRIELENAEQELTAELAKERVGSV